MVSNWEVLEHNDGGGIVDKGIGEMDLEEGIKVLPTKRNNMEMPKDAKRDTTPVGDEEGGLVCVVSLIPRGSLVRASGNMGDV